MLQTIKQRVLNAIPPTVLFLVLFFTILYICGLQDALIATFLTLEFMRLKTDEFVESTMIKSTVLYIIIAESCKTFNPLFAKRLAFLD